MDRQCDQCGAPLTGDNPRKRYCGSTCRQQARRAGSSDASVTPLHSSSSTETAENVGATERAVREQLTAADRLDTPDGAAAVVLARRLDEPGRDTGSAMASVAREMSARIEAALEGARVEGDPTDELQQRRNQKFAGGA